MKYKDLNFTVPGDKYLSRRNNEDDDEGSGSGKQLEFSVKSKTQFQFIVNIDEPFVEPSYYRNVIRMLNEASEDDVVVFYINSPGGQVSSLQSLIEGIKTTSANTVAVIVGQAASAASILSLHCDYVEVTDSAHMLCHYVSYGTGGKGADVLAHVNHTTKICNKLMRDTYKDFLTTSEIDELINGREIYLDSEQIKARLQNKADVVAGKTKSNKSNKSSKPSKVKTAKVKETKEE